MYIYENFGKKNAYPICEIGQEIKLSDDKIYIVEEQLGGGGESFVLKINEKNDDDISKSYAIKICKRRNKTRKNKEIIIQDKKFKQEIAIAKEFSSLEYKNNFITYHFDGYLALKKKKNHTDYHSYYVMDIANSTIEEYLCYRLKWQKEIEIFPKIKELVETVKMLHDKNYVHRDIKPQNILVHGELFKLSDYGMVIEENTTCEKYGPKYWPTPELLEMCDESIHCSGKQTDVFMLGCILYFIYTKKYPVGNVDINLIDDTYIMKPIIKKMISYKREDRYNCANEVYQEVNKISFKQYTKSEVVQYEKSIFKTIQFARRNGIAKYFKFKCNFSRPK